MIQLRDRLTNEKIKVLFKNNFELANYAIKLARYSIHSGHEVTVDDLLEEIRLHPNPSYLEDLKKSDLADKEEEEQEE